MKCIICLFVFIIVVILSVNCVNSDSANSSDVSDVPDDVNDSNDSPQDKNKMNLSGIPVTERFDITDRVWSKLYGDASVCLWKDDKLAAISISIDDNIPQEHDWWIGIGKKYGWSITWFVIVHYLEENVTGFGTWSDFRRLKSFGHDIQSHTYDHNHFDDQRYDVLVESSYKKSIETIEKNVPGAKVLTMAYPNGHGKEEIVKKYFIAARGVHGRPNIANRTNYTWTSSGIFTKEWIDNLIVFNPSESRYWRGWCALCFHDVAKGSTSQEKQASLNSASALFEYIHSREDAIWIENFTRIAKYAQERDSHILKVLKTDSSSIQLSLSDSLNNSIYAYPLTIKVPVSGSWTSQCVAFQNKIKIATTFIKRGNNGYVLIQAIPDCGNIFLFKSSGEISF